MVESASNDDPFERAARKERLARLREATDAYEENYAAGMLGITATWAVVLALHGWLSGTGGSLFRIHFIVFVLWSALPAGVVVFAIAARFLPRP